MINTITKLISKSKMNSRGFLSIIIDILLYMLIKINDAIHQTDYILQGTIVTMDSETSIIPSGYILIKDGLIVDPAVQG